MKTIIGSIASAACVAALVACSHDETPARTPVQETTTTTSSYQPQPQSTYMPPPPQESASSTYQAEPAQSQAQTDNDQIHPAAATPTPIDPSLDNKNQTQSPKTEPGPANAKQDKKSPNASAVTDQGNSKDEVKTSANIRKRMMASKTLSFGAKNVKVITSGTKVTLRGTVKNEAEHNEIVGIARNTDGVSEVDDQLQVKP